MADAAVRPAEPDDADEMARIQLITWRTAYAELLPAEVLAELDHAEAAAEWKRAIERSPATILVANEGNWLVGFGMAGPAPYDESADADQNPPEDADTVAQIMALLVEPRWGRRGHGGRLLAKLAAACRAIGATRGICWVPEADCVTVGFYRRAGWTPDGTVRTLDAGGRPLREIRLTGDLDLELT